MALFEKPAPTNQIMPTDTTPMYAALSTLKIMVVEDDADFRDLLCEMLMMLKHTVVSEASAEAAFAVLELDKVDVLISDVSLPGMSGVELAKKVHLAQPDVRIILSSGYGESVAAHLRFHVTVLSKPYSLNQLSQALAALNA